MSETPYKITLTLGTEKYTSSAKDCVEAILALKVPKISYRAIFRLDYKGKSSELPRRTQWARRILSNKDYAFHTAENLKLMLK